MSGWAGFSDAELRRMQQKDPAVSAAAPRGRKPPASSRSRQQLQRERALQLAAGRNHGAGFPGAGFPALPPEQQLNTPPLKEELQPAARSAAPAVKQQEQQELPEAKLEEKQQKAAGEASLVVQELEKQEVELRERTRLEQLQQEQKLIEERNKRKKALLAKTIAEKSKQTQAEAVKLKRIQKELQALDDMVSNEIGILRGKIEEASWEYTAARKRYEKAEAEYVTAKLDLHRKTDLKEQLTEHLCTIIQQNELRKARKLEELMQQLQLQAGEEELGGREGGREGEGEREDGREGEAEREAGRGGGREGEGEREDGREAGRGGGRQGEGERQGGREDGREDGREAGRQGKGEREDGREDGRGGGRQGEGEREDGREDGRGGGRQGEGEREGGREDGREDGREGEGGGEPETRTRSAQMTKNCNTAGEKVEEGGGGRVPQEDITTVENGAQGEGLTISVETR